jgi:putative transposase
MAVLAGVDFFTVEVLTWHGLATYYVLFFLHLETRRVSLAGLTRHLRETCMEQMARNAIDETQGYCVNIGTCCTIGTRSSVLRSGPF